jgi:hypothetical protein
MTEAVNPYDNLSSVVLPALCACVNYIQSAQIVSVLPLAANFLGTRTMVKDATVVAAGNFGNVVVGGGTHTVPVYSDGTNWRIG